MRARIVTIAIVLLPLTVHAQPPAKPAQAAPKGFRAEFLSDLDDVQGKVLQLARAMPAAKYSWRPGDGVRSVSEVFTHIAGSNYFLTTFLGVTPPASMPQEIESITDKKKIIVELQRSFDHLRGVMKATPEADFDKQVMMYGKPTTERGVFVMILSHVHEHLGQSIAYARMNGVVPPWSR